MCTAVSGRNVNKPAKPGQYAACVYISPRNCSLVGHFKLPAYIPWFGARKVNCSCVYSAYILKPVLSGLNL